MSAFDQKQTFATQKGMSALPTKADMCSALAHGLLGPKRTSNEFPCLLNLRCAWTLIHMPSSLHEPHMKSLPEELTTEIAAQEAWKQLQAIEQQFFSLHELVAHSQDQLRETFALMSQIEHMTQR